MNRAAMTSGRIHDAEANIEIGQSKLSLNAERDYRSRVSST